MKLKYLAFLIAISTSAFAGRPPIHPHYNPIRDDPRNDEYYQTDASGDFVDYSDEACEAREQSECFGDFNPNNSEPDANLKDFLHYDGHFPAYSVGRDSDDPQVPEDLDYGHASFIYWFPSLDF